MAKQDEHTARLAADWSKIFAPVKPLTVRRSKQPKARASSPTVAPSVVMVHGQAMEKLKGLSLRQPWAEEIMRGVKAVEYRSQSVNYRGRIYIYASLGRNPPHVEDEWAAEVGYGLSDLPRGVVVGTVEITGCEASGYREFAWTFADPQRLDTPVAPLERPQPIWFHPFGRPERA